MMRNESPIRKQEEQDDAFMADVLHGLRQKRRMIPPKHFYDDRGSHLFDLICATPEYYPTRTETGILEQSGAEMADRIGSSCMLIELGSGSAAKTPLLLRHLADDSVYVPIDICESYLMESTQRLAAMFPAIRMRPLCADYMQLPYLEPEDGLRRVIFFPGSTIGNCMPEEAVELLRHAASISGKDGTMLIGVDAKKSPEILNLAYNDAAGHTAAFNLNLLARMRRELGAEFDPDGFFHHAYYNALKGRIEMHLVSLRKQAIRLNGERFHFEEGESIHTENSYKYSVSEFRQLARQAGWLSKMVWSDREGWFNVHYLSRM